ncbi:MAG: 4Fe-4S dicluster domain-containing protein [Alistipes sp.]|nr:4Fe-4S dicluster domain-containing protein [Alistipes sp.]
MTFFAKFCIPFIIGTVFLFAVVLIKYLTWLRDLPKSDLKLIIRGIPTPRTLAAVWEVVCESLLHRRIFRVNPMLGYMHMSLAFGWFLLIAVGWIETVAYLGLRWVPLQGHVFFKYFVPLNGITEHKPLFDFAMDALLLFVLSGVGLAWFKRMRSRALGMKRTTKHILFDRIALSALWCIFPVRLLAESITAAIYGGGSFLTGGIGSGLASIMSVNTLTLLYEPIWWLYSIALGTFFVAMPFSRYMHIFTEIPLIFLRHYRLKPEDKEKSYDNFEVEACSRCGICIDPCQLQLQLGINDVQSVYFLRDRRYNMLQQKIANNCLMCGRCEQTCPVGINLNTLRLNSRTSMRNIPNEGRYNYLRGLDRSQGEGQVGYFAGCMTLLTPNTMTSMQRIFEAAHEKVWWADKEGGVCCGRPLRLTGETDSAQKMVDYNKALFAKHNITTLVTSCPICLRVLRDEYNLEGIEVLHHSEYILRLMRQGRLRVRYSSELSFTYHDPCELGRGSGIYDEPRAVIEAIGQLLEPEHNRKNAFCCGSSVANTAINDAQQLTIAQHVAAELDSTGAETVVTACPQCKKAIVRGSKRQVMDLSEIVAQNLR